MGDVGEEVVGCGVGQVVCEVLEGTLASHDCLSAIAEHGQLHSMPKVCSCALDSPQALSPAPSMHPHRLH